MIRRLVMLLPPVSEPWNPALKDTWRAMSDYERRQSRLVDLVLMASGLFVLWLVFGGAS